MTRRIIRLNPDGPDGKGLSPMTLEAEDFQSPLPRQNTHVYFSDPEFGMNVGVWDTTSMQEAFGPYPGDEFIVVLEGAFAMIDGAGRGVPAHKGQSVIFRNGTPVSWMQPGYLKKFFLTLYDPDAPVPSINRIEDGIIPLEPDAALSDDDEISKSDSGAKQRERVIFTNDAGTMTVGLWDTEAMITEPYPFPYHELAVVIEGTVTITGEDGTAETFGPGDAFFIPRGTITRWDVSHYLRKYYVAVAQPD
ncbi:MAG: DUF861 domain-containing protein [Rhodobacteraceae bacterium]|nr:DUF861 domain-containing protein [Paracoccaceae bacterium]